MIAIIPAKANSFRLPGKNMRQLCGKPMLRYSIEAALASRVFEKVVVSSRSDEVIKLVTDINDEELTHFWRNEELEKPEATVFDVCREVIETLQDGKNPAINSFAVLLPTSPLRNSVDIKSAYSLFESSKADCMMSVSPFEYPPQWALEIKNGCINKPEVLEEGLWNTRQDLTPLYKHDGHIIICKTGVFIKANDWLNMQVIPWHTPPERAIDIDVQADFDYAEYLIRRSSSKVEQLTRNEQVVGSSPTGGSGMVAGDIFRGA